MSLIDHDGRDPGQRWENPKNQLWVNLEESDGLRPVSCWKKKVVWKTSICPKSPGRELNPRPRPYQGRAIPLSHRGAFDCLLPGYILAGPEGIEPSTSGLEARRYIQAKPRAQRETSRCLVYLKSFGVRWLFIISRNNFLILNFF